MSELLVFLRVGLSAVLMGYTNVRTISISESRLIDCIDGIY